MAAPHEMLMPKACKHFCKKLSVYAATGYAQLFSSRCQKDVVEFMIGRPEVSRVSRVDALELLGASLANDKDGYDASAAFAYLLRAMEERKRPGEEPLPKPEWPVPDAYGGGLERRTEEEVASLEHDPAALHMEGLAVRERLLGAGNPEVPHPVVFRGAVFADDAAFDRCVALWRHALHLRRKSGASVAKDLLR